MSLADQLVIGWWLATIIVAIALLLLFHLNKNRRDTQDVILAMTRGVSPQELRYRTSYDGGTVISTLLTLFLIVALFLLISFFILLWYSNESRLTYLNFEVFLALVGTSMICMAFQRRLDWYFRNSIFRPAPNSIWEKILRVTILVFGALVLIVCSSIIIRDIFLPWQIVEGKVDSLHVRKSSRSFSHSYWIAINGQQYEATNDVFSSLNLGDHARAEMATGSKTIFRAQRIPITQR